MRSALTLVVLLGLLGASVAVALWVWHEIGQVTIGMHGLIAIGFLVSLFAAGLSLVPLGKEPSFGLLAIGSPDAERFHPTMSTEFLARIGDMVSEAVHAT